MKKKTIGLIVSIISLAFILVIIYGTGKPSYGSDFSSCHGTPSDISIEITGSEDISANTSSHVIFTINATGANLIIQLIPGMYDNDLFEILPTTNEIDDNSQHDLDLINPDVITVKFNVTTPATDKIYKLFILAAEDPFDAAEDPFTYLIVNINVGGISEPSTNITPFELFLDNYNLYLGGFTVLFLTIGTILFQINLSKKKESKIPGIFMVIAFAVITINIFLITNDAMDFTFKPNELSVSQNMDQLTHIILGSIGYITGIIVVFGTFTNVSGSKIKLVLYVMLFAWIFNFLFEIFIPTGG